QRKSQTWRCTWRGQPIRPDRFTSSTAAGASEGETAAYCNASVQALRPQSAEPTCSLTIAPAAAGTAGVSRLRQGETLPAAGVDGIARQVRTEQGDGEIAVAAKRRTSGSARLARCGGQGVVLIAEMGREPGAAARRGHRSPVAAPLDPVLTTVPAVGIRGAD